MPQIELIMPKMGESVAEATIIKWLKNEGDPIAADEAVLEIATDKVDSEVPSATEGFLLKKLFNEGEVVQVGKAIALISTEKNAPIQVTTPVTTPVTASVESKPTAVSPSLSSTLAQTAATNTSDRFYSPLVKNIAKEEGISIVELDNIAGTGKDGRVTKQDILAYLPSRSSQNAVPTAVPGTVKGSGPANGQVVPMTKQSIPVGQGDEIIEMDRMRKLIAEHMVMSKHTSPHVTSFVEADVTNLVVWRDKVKNDFEKKEKEKITFTPLFIEAVVKAIKDFPMINVSVDGTTIIKKKNINIGMAAALPSGNLIVPVIKNADQLNLIGITKMVNDLAGRARINKLTPDEIQGGTFTISNVGTFGNVMGTPIINQPQVAILATGSIKKKPVVVETALGDTIAIRSMMFLSLSYDHRVVDGALGGSFLKRIADYLEGFDINRSII